VVRSLNESQQMMGDDKSSEDSQILVTKGEPRKKYGYQQGNFQSKDITNVQCHYCGEFGHVHVKCRAFKEDLQHVKELVGKSKSTRSANVVNHEDDLLICETSGEGGICCSEVGIHQSPTLTKVKKGKVGNYYKSDELI